MLRTEKCRKSHFFSRMQQIDRVMKRAIDGTRIDDKANSLAPKRVEARFEEYFETDGNHFDVSAGKAGSIRRVRNRS